MPLPSPYTLSSCGVEMTRLRKNSLISHIPPDDLNLFLRTPDNVAAFLPAAVSNEPSLDEKPFLCSHCPPRFPQLLRGSNCFVSICFLN